MVLSFAISASAFFQEAAGVPKMSRGFFCLGEVTPHGILGLSHALFASSKFAIAFDLQ
jgi:hypothetical protein